MTCPISLFSSNMRCPYCQQTKSQALGWKKGEFELYRCDTCKNLFILPLLTPQEIEAYYQNSYLNRTDAHVAKEEAAVTPFYAKLIRKRLPTAKTVYEVGPSEGQLLYGLARRGYLVRGYELSEHSCDVGRRILGVPMVAGLLPATQTEKADVLISSHTAEHLIDPKSEFDHYAENIRSGGILIATVPNAASLLFHIFKKYHPWYAQPDHLFYFTPENLADDLRGAGFQIKKVFTRSDKFSFGVFILLALRSWLKERRSPQQAGAWKTLLTTPEERSLEARRKKARLLNVTHRALWLFSKPMEWLLGLFNLNEELWIIAEKR